MSEGTIICLFADYMEPRAYRSLNDDANAAENALPTFEGLRNYVDKAFAAIFENAVIIRKANLTVEMTRRGGQIRHKKLNELPREFMTAVLESETCRPLSGAVMDMVAFVRLFTALASARVGWFHTPRPPYNPHEHCLVAKRVDDFLPLVDDKFWASLQKVRFGVPRNLYKDESNSHRAFHAANASEKEPTFKDVKEAHASWHSYIEEKGLSDAFRRMNLGLDKDDEGDKYDDVEMTGME
ncbi:hypothetical protein QBC38DRAFT_451735 [Podospora fimiseda]|uniref:Uncharacterized protein n=1 Tax=Podospora fimiseda TaxID=252190 RepID=A0AAN7BWZ8_9PEZI|nr:hypothetical protein QBC38DRAFT_451735 [Podospora fimiseda]